VVADALEIGERSPPFMAGDRSSGDDRHGADELTQLDELLVLRRPRQDPRWERSTLGTPERPCRRGVINMSRQCHEEVTAPG
jgi:hypothetical protein